MKKMTLLAAMAAVAVALTSCCNSGGDTSEQVVYESDWKSLSRHQTPEWLMDAKFGIYCHWGPQTYIDQYHKKGMTFVEAFDHWKGEKFDAAAWAELFKKTGAQFAGPVAQHCSGCLNWDSEITDWNSVKRGPKIDILGELSREIKKRDMKLLASFHTVTYGSTWGGLSKEDPTYCEPIEEFDSIRRDDTRWLRGWEDRLDEATTKYGVDLMWFDTSFGFTVGGELQGYIKDGKFMPDTKLKNKKAKIKLGSVKESAQRNMIANFFNYAEREGKEVEVIYKSQDIPYNIGMRDIEDGNLDGAQFDPWMTDINMLLLPPGRWGSWFYDPDCPIKDANLIVDMLIDVTSKNGRLLLNVPPMADGTFAPNILAELDKIGAWLKVNGEGIYGSTPWCIYGEGPTSIKHPGHHGHTHMRGKEIAAFTGEDIRYTSNGNDIYAYVLGKPSTTRVRFAALGSGYKLYPDEVEDVKLLGSNAKVEWSLEENGLYVTLPANTPDAIAYGFKVIIK